MLIDKPKGARWISTLLLSENVCYSVQQILLMFVKGFFLEVAPKKWRTKLTHQIAGFEKKM